MSNSGSPASVIGRKRRPRRREIPSDSEDGSPIAPGKRKTRSRVIIESSDSDSEVEVRRGRRRTRGANPVIVSDSENAPESDDDRLVCSICLNNVYDSALQGRPASCSHTFCFECINTWSKNDSSCVLCRVPFSKLQVLLRGKVLEELPVKKVSLALDETMQFDPAHFCHVCRNYDIESSLALCDECDARYHQECLNVPLAHAPGDPWRCPRCESESSWEDSEDDDYEPEEERA